MSKALTTPRYISQLVEGQLPDFVKDNYPQFIQFLKTYYEWFEKNGVDVFTAKILGSTQTTITLPNTADPDPTGYIGMSIVALNGPTKGHTRTIVGYDPSTFTVTINPPWTLGFIPPTNTNMVIRDSMYPNKLLEYRDVDQTLDQLLPTFADEFLYQVPGTMLANERTVLKHIKQFFQARGNEDSFRFLFRIMFNEPIGLYYPKVDMLLLDEADWFVDHVMRVTTTTDTFGWTAREVIGILSGATASVEGVLQTYIDGMLVTDLHISSINGAFGNPSNPNLPEPVKVVYPFTPPPQTDLGALSDLEEPSTITLSETAYLVLSGLEILNPGQAYEVGDPISITGGGCIVPAQAQVSAIDVTYYTGSVQIATGDYYVQPFFGPDPNEPTGNPLNYGVCVPGLYFFSDLQYSTIQPLLAANQVILAYGSPTEDGFFDGDQISLVNQDGFSQQRTIISYIGALQIATVNADFNPIPDITTQYTIVHNRGGITAVAVTNFGLGFTSTPTATITSSEGTGAVLLPEIGMVGTSAGTWLPGRDGGIGGLPTTPDSLLDTNKVIQDSLYWQDFSYDIQSGMALSSYVDVVKPVLHPAGMKMFGSVWVQSVPDTSTLLTIPDTPHTIAIDAQVYNMTETVSSEYTLIIQQDPTDVVTIGTTLGDIDAFKFTVFPPPFPSQYPSPNNDYWTSTGPANTQISNFQDVIIGDFINNPNQRTNIAFDSYVIIPSDATVVGVVGPNCRTLARWKFFGFPPYAGDPAMYPSPNQHYWAGPANTQIKDVQNIPIEDCIIFPETFKSNFCVDSDIEIYQTSGGIPPIGDLVEYSFREGMNSQIVYNVAPGNFNTYDGCLGHDETVESVDPAYTSFGISVNATDNQFVNATGIPLSLKQMTVIVVAQGQDLSTNRSIVTSVQSGADNGYSIDLTQSGGLFFRMQYEGSACGASYPTSTLSVNEWFMATMIFNNGSLTGQLNQQTPVYADYPDYPINPIYSSAGWYIGKGSASFTVTPITDLFSGADFNTVLFDQSSNSSTTTNFTSFDGQYAYLIVYDRALYSFEVTSIYLYMQSILASRGISLP